MNQLGLNDLPNEIWKDIIGYDGKYMVSNLGRVKAIGQPYSTKGFYKNRGVRPDVIKKTCLVSGYHSLSLCKNGKKRFTQVHRLIGEAFISNPNNLPCINHKNAIRHDNRLENLEWCDYAYNAQHGFEVGNRYVYKGKDNNRSHKIIAICIETNEEKLFYGQREAARELNISQAQIFRVLNGIEKQAKGYKFIKADVRNTELV